ncbi:hypothetical protein NKJ55_15875 [Mesorhizobium sp. M0106]|uniref:hypothetical protein n=1 Tax=Mesorhizobium sp. M0106 TaxID=2956880 RepID=UPI00333915E1
MTSTDVGLANDGMNAVAQDGNDKAPVQHALDVLRQIAGRSLWLAVFAAHRRGLLGLPTLGRAASLAPERRIAAFFAALPLQRQLESDVET